jgi:hypothetical protein
MTESHLDLRCNVGQLSAALADSTDIEHFLYKLSEVSHIKGLGRKRKVRDKES